MLEMNCDLCHNFHPLGIAHFGECSPYYGCLQFDSSFLEKKKKKKKKAWFFVYVRGSTTPLVGKL